MLARPEGLEPSTPGLEGRCSIQLSYGRVSAIVAKPKDGFVGSTVGSGGRGGQDQKDE